MRILSVGFDRTILSQSNTTPGDTRDRHIRYVRALRRKYPGSSLIAVVPALSPKSALPEQVEPGLSVLPILAPRTLFATAALLPLHRLLSERSFDLITTQTPFDDGLLGLVLGRRFKLPLHVQMNSSFLDNPYWLRLRFHHRAFNFIGKRVSSRAATLRVVCRAERDRLESMYPGLKGKVIDLHPLVNRCFFDARESQSNPTLTVSAWARGGPLFLFVGRLAPEKNLPTLLKAFQQLSDKKGKLILVGDGVMREKLKREATRLGIAERVYWAGNQPLVELHAWYSMASATILPSFYEGFGKVIVESYFKETPVVVTPFASAAELVEPGRTGFILRCFEDPAELSQVLGRLSTEASLVSRMGKLGKRKVLDYLLDEDEYMEKLISIWEKSVNGNGSSTTE